MEVVRQLRYTQEVPIHQLAPEQYMAASQRAVARLHWHVASVTGNSIICYTRTNDGFTGRQFIITVQQKKVTLRLIPADAYPADEAGDMECIELYKQAIDRVIEEHRKADRNLHPMHREKFGALIPSKSYLISPLIIYANVLILLAMVLVGISPLHPTAQSLLLWGGNFRPAVVQGQWWRLVTYMFLHGGIMHLIMNTYALLYIGMFLEPLLGKLRFTAAYLLTGICAGLMSMAIHPFSVGVGASGAIFGMYGVFLSMLTTDHIQKTMRKTMLRSILFFVVLNLLSGLQGNTDNAAHIGGLIGGLIIGYAYYPGIAKRAPLKSQLFTTALCASCVLLLAVLAITILGHTA